MLYCIHNSRINPLKLIWLFCLCESSWFGSRFDSRLKASPNSKEVFCLGESSLHAYKELPSDQTTFLSRDKQIVSSLCELRVSRFMLWPNALSHSRQTKYFLLLLTIMMWRSRCYAFLQSKHTVFLLGESSLLVYQDFPLDLKFFRIPDNIC